MKLQLEPEWPRELAWLTSWLPGGVFYGQDLSRLYRTFWVGKSDLRSLPAKVWVVIHKKRLPESLQELQLAHAELRLRGML